jgi:hypothetical protein
MSAVSMSELGICLASAVCGLIGGTVRLVWSEMVVGSRY